MTDWLNRLQVQLDAPWAKLAARIARILFFVGMVVWLVLKVRAIGWRDVLSSLPTNPLYYIIFVVMFLALPLSETLIFRLIFKGLPFSSFPVFIRKRILNSALVGYSGEVYFFLWAQQHLKVPAKRILLGIKDNAILSAVASTVLALLLLILFAISGQGRVLTDWLSGARTTIIVTVLIAVFLIPLIIRLRRQIISLPASIAASVFTVHIVRLALLLLLQAAQWAVVLPYEPWKIWLVFLTMQMIVSRLPLIPNRDLLFLSAGLEMSNIVEGPRDAMAGLLLAGGALLQGSNLIFFLLTSIRRPSDAAIATTQLPDVDDDRIAEPAE